MDPKGRTVLITGGASGLGAATARALVGRGARVMLLDVARDRGEALASELGDGARFAQADVADEAQVSAAIARCRAELGGLHGVVGCAGVGAASRVLGKEGVMPLANFERAVRINLVGMFNVARLAAAAMSENEPSAEGERGVIVQTASVAAYDGQIGQAAYGASKAGVVGLTLPLAREFARLGIRVVTIAPGIFDTPMLAALPEAARASLGQQVPFPPRLGRPDEYAALAVHIFDNVMLNGETIRLDGALRMAPK